MNQAKRPWSSGVVILQFVLLYPAWLLLQLLHETGHVLHAWISGATGIRLVLPLVGFSRTDVTHNPSPVFVAAGGALWGSLLPVLIWLILPRRWPVLRQLAQAFAGLCLIGNGLYLGVGWIDRVGDAGDLMKHGVPSWLLMLVGLPLAMGGLWLWYLLGRRNTSPGDVE